MRLREHSNVAVVVVHAPSQRQLCLCHLRRERVPLAQRLLGNDLLQPSNDSALARGQQEAS
eukprot:8733263-Pyramimonas_sp.AAC.1